MLKKKTEKEKMIVAKVTPLSTMVSAPQPSLSAVSPPVQPYSIVTRSAPFSSASHPFSSFSDQQKGQEEQDEQQKLQKPQKNQKSLHDFSSSSTSCSSFSTPMWEFCGMKISKECVTYLMRTILLYVIVIASVVNVSLNIKPVEIWITLLILGLSGMGINVAGTVIAKEKQLMGSFKSSTSSK